MPMNSRLLRPRATGFNPKSISGLAAWWDAGVVSSLAQLSTGSTAVTAKNDPVGYWADLSGNGRNLTQSSTNNRPLYTTNVLNGRPVINFDGSNDAMLASFTLAQPIHYFLVYRFDSAYVSANPRVFDGASGNSLSFSATNGTEMGLFAGLSNQAVNISDAERQAFSVTEVRANGASSSVFRNGTNKTSGSSNIGTGTPNGIYLGVFGNGFSAPGDVSFAEILIYTSILSTSQAAAVRSYLGRKFNITVA